MKLPPAACHALELYVQHGRPVLAARRRRPGRTNQLLINTHGTPFTTETLGTCFRTLQREEGAPWGDHPFTVFRHAYAEAAYERLTRQVAGAAPRELGGGAAAMGHTVQTQVAHYAGDTEGQLLARATELAAAPALATGPARGGAAAAAGGPEHASSEGEEGDTSSEESDGSSSSGGRSSSSSGGHSSSSSGSGSSSSDSDSSGGGAGAGGTHGARRRNRSRDRRGSRPSRSRAKRDSALLDLLATNLGGGKRSRK